MRSRRLDTAPPTIYNRFLLTGCRLPCPPTRKTAPGRGVFTARWTALPAWKSSGFDMMRIACWPLSFAISLLLMVAARADEKLGYNRDIRPILAENCFACHGPDSAARKADLRLDQREAAVESGAIVPGKPDESELVTRILLDRSRDELMPPPAIAQEADGRRRRSCCTRWIAEGAEYQPHWSFIAPVRPRAAGGARTRPGPATRSTTSSWRKLEAAGLAAGARSRSPHAGPPR